MQQGQICVIDYENLTEREIFLFFAPNFEAVTQEALTSLQLFQRRRINVKKTNRIRAKFLAVKKTSSISPGKLCSSDGA